MANPRPSRPQPKFRRKKAISSDFCEKSKIFQKFYLIFTHFSCEIGTFDLQRPQPHPSARADSSRGYKNRRIPPRQSSAKKRMARQQSDELERTKRELLVTDQPLRRRRHSRARPRRDSGLESPPRQGQRHTRRTPACRSSRSRKRTVAFAAAGQTFRQNCRRIEKKQMKELRCFLQKNATTEKVHADVSQNP